MYSSELTRQYGTMATLTQQVVLQSVKMEPSEVGKYETSAVEHRSSRQNHHHWCNNEETKEDGRQD